MSELYRDVVFLIGNNLIREAHLRAVFISFLIRNIESGTGCAFRNNIEFYSGGKNSGRLYIGKHTFINNSCFIDYSSEVVIGDDVAIGMKVVILSSTHSMGNEKRCGKVKNKKTIIEDGCWIGANATIYPGVKVFRGSVIAAGEVVYENVPENTLLKNGKLVPLTNSGV